MRVSGASAWLFSALGLVVAVSAIGGCTSNDAPAGSPTETTKARLKAQATQTPESRTTDTGTDPLANTDGTKPGLGPVPRSQLPVALALINAVDTKGRGPKTGYARAEFGRSWTDHTQVPFSGDGCYTRDNILLRDLVDPQRRDRCVVVSGTLPDPYTGQLLPFRKSDASAIQIDHIVPLSFAWQMGAARWTKSQRTNFANDPLNLLAVAGRTNSQKSDSGPASWLPANKSIRCAYSTRIAQVATKYRLAIPVPDKAMMSQQCS